MGTYNTIASNTRGKMIVMGVTKLKGLDGMERNLETSIYV